MRKLLTLDGTPAKKNEVIKSFGKQLGKSALWTAGLYLGGCFLYGVILGVKKERDRLKEEN